MNHKKHETHEKAEIRREIPPDWKKERHSGKDPSALWKMNGRGREDFYKSFSPLSGSPTPKSTCFHDSILVPTHCIPRCSSISKCY